MCLLEKILRGKSKGQKFLRKGERKIAYPHAFSGLWIKKKKALKLKARRREKGWNAWAMSKSKILI